MKIFRGLFNTRFWSFGGWFTFVAVAIGGAAVLGSGVALYEGAQSREAANSAINSEQNILGGLQYQPIDIASLQKQATAASIADATNSLALQRSLQPNVARANDLLQKSVADQLALGGQLSPDAANQAAQAARVSGGSSGAIGSVGPETAALIGQSSLSLLQQRQANAAALEAANPAPTVGLSATDLASAIEANSNAANQFALGKAGAQTGLLNSQAQAAAGGNAGTSASVSQLASLLSLLGTKGATPTTTLQPGSVTPAATGTFNTPLGVGYLNGAQPVSTSGSTIGGGS